MVVDESDILSLATVNRLENLVVVFKDQTKLVKVFVAAYLVVVL